MNFRGSGLEAHVLEGSRLNLRGSTAYRLDLEAHYYIRGFRIEFEGSGLDLRDSTAYRLD